MLFYRKALSKDSLYKRLNAIYQLQSGCPFVVAEIDALLQIFPKKLPVIEFMEGEDLDFMSLPQWLFSLGYTRSYEVESKGSFALRGDILDIFPINEENPVRIDFFGDTVEKIKPYDLATGERLPSKKRQTLLAATDVVLKEGEQEKIARILDKESKNFKTSEAYSRAREIVAELLDNGGERSFLLPLLENSTDIFNLLPKDTVIVFDEGKALWDKFNAIYKEHEERFHRLRDGGEAFAFSFYQLQEKQSFLQCLAAFRQVVLQTFSSNPFFFEPMKIFNFRFTPTSRYLNGIPALVTDLKNWLKGGYRTILFCGDENRALKMRDVLLEEYLPVKQSAEELSMQGGVTISSESVEKGFVLHECKLAVIGTNDLYVKPSESKRIRRKRGDTFSSPEVGDYAVHETHGIGKMIGTKKI